MVNCLLSCVARPNLYKHCIRAYLVVKIVPAHAVITETNNKNINGDIC